MGAPGVIFSGAGFGRLKGMAHDKWALGLWVLAAITLSPALLQLSLWNARPKGAT
jgi:hypothetical protein